MSPIQIPPKEQAGKRKVWQQALGRDGALGTAKCALPKAFLLKTFLNCVWGL